MRFRHWERPTCSAAQHEAIKACPVLWLRDLVNHRRWELASADMAECPSCHSTLVRPDAPASPVGDSTVTDWSAAEVAA